MKLLTSPSLLFATVLRRVFMAAANRRKIGKPESLMRGQEPRQSWEALMRLGPQRLRVGTTALA